MKLHIPYPVWQQMRVYVTTCAPCEVTGIGAVEILNENEAIVEEIFLPCQEVTPIHSEFLQGEEARILIEYDDKHPNETYKLRFRWHSHGMGKPYWSKTDEEDIARWKGEQVFNLVTNVAGECLARMDLFQPQHEKNIPVEVIIHWPELDEKTKQQYTNEVYEKIPNIQRRTSETRQTVRHALFRPSATGRSFLDVAWSYLGLFRRRGKA